MFLCSKTKTNTLPMCEVLDKDTIKSEFLPHWSVSKRGCVSKNNLTEVIQHILYKLKNGYQWQIVSAFPWCCFRWPWAAWPANARAGSSKRTCFLCYCPRACVRHNRFCLVFSKNFNIMSALFVHQSLTRPQIFDSREGLFWCKKGVACECCKMNLYSNGLTFAPDFGLFAAKSRAICSKTQCVLLLNAVRFGAKRSAICR